MSVHYDRLSRARDRIDRVMKTTRVGTVVKSREVTLFELAVEHANAWAADRPPKGEPGHERGGSSSPREMSDRREENGVRRRAAEAAARLPKNAHSVERLMDEIYRDTVFLTSITGEDPEDPVESLPGCRSCARFGAFSKVYDKVPAAKASGLCRTCWEWRDPDGTVPAKPVEWRHSGQKLKLSDWLAKNRPELSRAKPGLVCGTPIQMNGVGGYCQLPVLHSGQCAIELAPA